MIDLEFEHERKKNASIKVIGIGGAGGNTVNSIIASGCQNIEFIAANTDAQALEQSLASHKIQIGIKSTKGLGTGTDPELGRRSAEEDIEKIIKVVGDADIVFLAGGMGKGTGSGALPVIAHALKELGILTIAVITKPFIFEGKRRATVAQTAIEILQKEVDALIVIPNQKLLDIVGDNVPMTEAFSMINNVLSQSITGISDIITKPGHINVDFADVRAIIKDTGLAIMGTGKASGPNRGREAALMAITSPILENMDIEGARGVVLNITGGKNLGLHEISDAASVIYAKADENANIIIGSVIDESMTDEICVTVIATGFTRQQKEIATQKTSPAVAQAPVPQRSDIPHARKISGHEAEELKITDDAGDFEEQFLREFEQELRATAPQQAEVQKTPAQAAKRHEDHAKIEQHIDTSDLDIPAFLRKKSQEQVRD